MHWVRKSSSFLDSFSFYKIPKIGEENVDLTDKFLFSDFWNANYWNFLRINFFYCIFKLSVALYMKLIILIFSLIFLIIYLIDCFFFLIHCQTFEIFSLSKSEMQVLFLKQVFLKYLKLSFEKYRKHLNSSKVLLFRVASLGIFFFCL